MQLSLPQPQPLPCPKFGSALSCMGCTLLWTGVKLKSNSSLDRVLGSTLLLTYHPGKLCQEGPTRFCHAQFQRLL